MYRHLHSVTSANNSCKSKITKCNFNFGPSPFRVPTFTLAYHT